MERGHHSYYSPTPGSTSFDTSLPALPPVTSFAPERKRRRVSHTNPDPGLFSGVHQNDVAIESIDLTEGSSALSKALAKQREDAVRAQQDGEHEQGRSSLTEYKCPVCMDTPVDATSTDTFFATSVSSMLWGPRRKDELMRLAGVLVACVLYAANRLRERTLLGRKEILSLCN
ncbi:hypothetical protein FE257_003255 [Aspergillus nanangensis]|uniref:Uncharacterized protein n=1 Tax=Aspergillus nanangensis TaxID=2582783 RepID=A0AAD4CS91_ASPNN|nr:hypothetical protein FE257_003255 [Aspergillus nanangensis]